MHERILDTAWESLYAGETVRFTYGDHDIEGLERVINTLIEKGASVTCENPFSEPAWVELQFFGWCAWPKTHNVGS